MVGRRVRRWLTRHGPTVVLALVLTFSAISLWQAWDIAAHFRREARESSRRFGLGVAALSDTTPGAETDMLLNMVRSARETGMPIVVTDSTGNPTQYANLPRRLAEQGDAAAIRTYARQLDRVSAPIRVTGGTTIHYGALPVARRVNWLRGLQLAVLVLLVAVGVWAYRSALERHRDRVWVGMARESAHQLGTPLMSASAWADRLHDSADPQAQEIGRHLSADLERLERVAQRFERIGRPARRSRVALGALADRVAAYFRPRLPQRAHQVDLTVRAAAAGPTISADPVLVEWALEALVRNAIDALSGRGGHVTITVEAAGPLATMTVADDGPGIDPELRRRLFEPGVTTKRGGWGLGLALARRIVEDVHGGRLEHVPSEAGSVFRADFPTDTSE